MSEPTASEGAPPTGEPPKKESSAASRVVVVVACMMVITSSAVFWRHNAERREREAREALEQAEQGVPAAPATELLGTITAIDDADYKATLAESGGGVGAMIVAESSAPIFVEVRTPKGRLERIEVSPDIAKQLKVGDELSGKPDGSFSIRRAP